VKVVESGSPAGIGELPSLTENTGGFLPALDPRHGMGRETLIEANRIAYPAVAAGRSRKDGAGVAAGGAVALLLGAATFWGLSGGRQGGQDKSLPAAAPVAGPPAPLTPSAPGDQAVILSPESGPSAGSLVFGTSPQPLAVGPAGPRQSPDGRTSALAERYRSPSLVVDQWRPAGPSAGGLPANPSGIQEGPSKATDEFAARADASASDTASATRMADPGHTVSQGTLIPAVLETAIDSDLPGYVRAVVSQDVRSFDGSRVLIPRSSRLIGQYRSGLSAGQTRAYVLWSRLIRPDGVSVAIASPAADEAGRTGLTGEVDGHFFKRFGSALLLSVVEAASAVGTGGASLLVSRGSAAGVSAQQNGAIPPTIRVRQGQLIRVFTARDLDFGRVAETARR
jgi:type IV secretion system protein VirB10